MQLLKKSPWIPKRNRGFPVNYLALILVLVVPATPVKAQPKESPKQQTEKVNKTESFDKIHNDLKPQTETDCVEKKKLDKLPDVLKEKVEEKTEEEGKDFCPKEIKSKDLRTGEKSN
jgi:hypothetical protein